MFRKLYRFLNNKSKSNATELKIYTTFTINKDPHLQIPLTFADHIAVVFEQKETPHV